MAEYFSHDMDARNDQKMIKMRQSKDGCAKYGCYWMIVEKMASSKGYFLEKDYNSLAWELRLDNSLVKSVIEDFGLFDFTEDGKCFYSESLNRRMAIKESKSKKAKDAAAARWSKNGQKPGKNADALHSHCSSNTDAMQLKEIKGNDIDVNIISGPPVKPPNTFGYVPDHESLKAELKKPSVWKDMFGKQSGISNPDDRDDWIDEFVEHAIADGKGEQILKVSEAQSWITNWVRIRIRAGETPKSRKQPKSSSDHLAAVAGIPLN